MLNAMIVEPKDNVIVAIEPIKKGETVTYMCEGAEKTLTALGTSPSITSWLPATSPRVSPSASTVSTSAWPPATSRWASMSTATTWKSTGKTWMPRAEKRRIRV